MKQHPRADSNVLGIGATVGKSKDLIALFETATGSRTQRFDDAAKLYAEGRWCLWWQWVASTTLDNVHTIDTECLDADESLALRRGGLFRLVVDEQGISLAFAASNICVVVLDVVRCGVGCGSHTDSSHGVVRHCESFRRKCIVAIKSQAN